MSSSILYRAKKATRRDTRELVEIAVIKADLEPYHEITLKILLDYNRTGKLPDFVWTFCRLIVDGKIPIVEPKEV